MCVSMLCTDKVDYLLIRPHLNTKLSHNVMKRKGDQIGILNEAVDGLLNLL